MSDGVGVSGGASEDGTVALKQVANLGKFHGVGKDLRAEFDLLENLVNRILRGWDGGFVPMFEFGEGGHLGNANREAMGVEHGDGDGTVFSNNGNGGADDNVQVARADAVADAVEKDGGAGRHRRGHANVDDFLQATRGHLYVPRGEGKRADGGS